VCLVSCFLFYFPTSMDATLIILCWWTNWWYLKWRRWLAMCTKKWIMMFITHCVIWIGERCLVMWTNNSLMIQVRSSVYQRWLVNFFAWLSWCNWWNLGPEGLVWSSTNAIMLLEGHAEERKLYGLQQPVNLSFFWVIIFDNCTTAIASFPLNFIMFF
jgi:hypothetical protein